MINNESEAHWDAKAVKWDKKCKKPIMQQYRKNLLDNAAPELKNKKNAVVVDCGCGSGWLTKDMLLRGDYSNVRVFILFDISKNMLELAINNLAEIIASQDIKVHGSLDELEPVLEKNDNHKHIFFLYEDRNTIELHKNCVDFIFHSFTILSSPKINFPEVSYDYITRYYDGKKISNIRLPVFNKSLILNIDSCSKLQKMLSTADKNLQNLNRCLNYIFKDIQSIFLISRFLEFLKVDGSVAIVVDPNGIPIGEAEKIFPIRKEVINNWFNGAAPKIQKCDQAIEIKIKQEPLSDELNSLIFKNQKEYGIEYLLETITVKKKSNKGAGDRAQHTKDVKKLFLLFSRIIDGDKELTINQKGKVTLKIGAETIPLRMLTVTYNNIYRKQSSFIIHFEDKLSSLSHHGKRNITLNPGLFH